MEIKAKYTQGIIPFLKEKSAIWCIDGDNIIITVEDATKAFELGMQLADYQHESLVVA